MPGNVDKTIAASVTAILGYDTKFYEQLPRLFPHADAKAWFVGNESFANDTAYKCKWRISFWPCGCSVWTLAQ